jgi:hypothetical protein
LTGEGHLGHCDRMRRPPSIALLALTLAACGGQLQSTSSSDGGDVEDVSFQPDGNAAEAAATVPPDGGYESSSLPDAGPDGAVCGFIEAGVAICVPCPGTLPSGTCDFNGVSCSYPGGECTCSSSCGANQCCPASCAQLGFPCAPAGDGCGGILNCRQCPAGLICDKDGSCNGPGDAGCVPAGCSGGECGLVDDGCGGKIDCGGCFWSCVLSGP